MSLFIRYFQILHAVQILYWVEIITNVLLLLYLFFVYLFLFSSFYVFLVEADVFILLKQLGIFLNNITMMCKLLFNQFLLSNQIGLKMSDFPQIFILL